MKLKRSHTRGTPRLTLLDETMASYLKWRVESGAVADSYRDWRSAADSERGVAFDRYFAALDREEHAASGYQRLVELAHMR
jgi:hypothetical protein